MVYAFLMRHFNSYGIKFKYGRLTIRHQVNETTAKLLEETCELLSKMGAVEILTLGIRDNRIERGASLKPCNTSTHADGLYPDYKKWGDGTVGCRALDIVEVRWNDGTVSNVEADRPAMIMFCEALGWTILHKNPLPSSDHIHINTKLLK